MSKKRRLHPIEIAACNASFDILGYIRKKYKEALNKKGTMKEKEISGQASSVIIDGIKVPTMTTEFVSANCLEIQVGTTGKMGGDTGHGGRTYLRIKSTASSDLRSRVVANGEHYDFDRACGTNQVEIILGGDTELDTFFDCMQYAADVLGQYTAGVMEYQPSRMEIRQMNFCEYINELCKLYRATGKLKGSSDIRDRHHVTGISQQQFFECDLHRATGYVGREFTDKLYESILDTNCGPLPIYHE